MQLSLSQTPKSISSANYLLRQYGGAAAAYSLQRLDTGSENVVRVRRSSDDAEADFTAEEVSGGALASYCGAGNGFVTTWYDQSGNGRNATQATAASQPQIVADGVVVTDGNGNPAMSFDGTDDWLDHSYNVTLTSQSHFFLSQIESTAGADTRMYAMAVGTNADVTSTDLHIPAIKTSILQRISVFDGGHIGASDITYGSPFLWTVLHSGSLISPFLDGSARPTGARTLNAAVTRQFIGAGCNTGTGPFLYTECKIAELIIYDNSNKSADRTAIEANIASRYGIVI